MCCAVAGEYWLLFVFGLVTSVLGFVVGDKSTVVLMFHIAVAVCRTARVARWGGARLSVFGGLCGAAWSGNGFVAARVLHPSSEFVGTWRSFVLSRVQLHSQTEDISLKKYCVVELMACSLSFSSPIGYVTNLIVQGPGRHSFGDFTRFGIIPQLGLMFLTPLLTMKLIQ